MGVPFFQYIGAVSLVHRYVFATIAVDQDQSFFIFGF